MLHREIAKELGYGVSTVTRHLIDMGIKSKSIDKEKVLELHNKGLSDKEIAELLGCTRSNITVCLNKMGYRNRKSKIDNIELRNKISNSLIGRYVGELNPNYKGNSSEKSLARGLCKTISKRLIRNNNFTCCHCKKRGGDLETHHIKPFHIIMDEFFKTTYNGDINTLYEQLMSYPDFVDESNMVVLCHDCHVKIHYSDDHELSPYRWESATTIENTQ